MKLMMVCPTCEGKGEITVKSGGTVLCGTCHGKAVVEPSAQILDDLECAEIERELLDKAFEIDWLISDGECTLTLWFDCNVDVEFVAETKLEALRKAKNWMDGRGAE